MKKANLVFTSLILMSAMILGSAPRLCAEENSSGGALSLPWSEFEKLLKLNQDNVTLTWDEFQRLIKQTGVQETPDFQVQNGNVVLSRAEFKKLLDRMKSPPSETPQYFLTKAVYTGKIGSQSSNVKVQIRLQVLGKEGGLQRVRIPLFRGSMAFQEVLLDNEPALIENDGNWLYLTTSKIGDHLITASFSAASSLKKAPHELSFNIPRTPITQLDLTIPIPNLDVQVDNAMQTELSQVSGGTQIRATLPAGESVMVRWNPVTPEKEKGPAKVYADVYSLLTIEEDALRVRTMMELDVLQNTVNTLNIKVPQGFNVLEVQGESIGDWKVAEDGGVLVVPLQYAHKGKFNLTIISELVLKDKNSVAAFDGFQVLKAVREKGFVGVELKTSAEAKALDIKGLDRVDVQELPQALLNLANRPLIFGFKYLRQPYSVSLDIQRHEEVAVISTVIDEANGVTLVLEDGKRVHHMTYTVRNSWKQFLELSLPEGAQVWSASVEGQRVQPSKNANGKVLIPLNRSKAINGNLNSFEVELMYYQGTPDLSLVGKESIQFPIPDVVVSQMLWSVYLPINYDYLYFGGSVDKESDAEGLRPLATVLTGQQKVLRDLSSSSSIGGLYQQGQSETSELKQQRMANLKNTEVWNSRGRFSEKQGVDDAAYARQVDKELSFFSKVQEQAVQQAGTAGTPTDPGVSPIRVKVPNTGKVFRFNKRIVVDQTPLNLMVVYVNHGMVQFLMFALLLGVLFVLFKFKDRLKLVFLDLQAKTKKHQATWQWCLSPVGLVITTLVGAILVSFVSRILFVIMMLALLGAVGRLIWTKLEAKKIQA